MKIKNNEKRLIVLKYSKEIKKSGKVIKDVGSLNLMPGLNDVDMSKSDFDNHFKNNKAVQYYLDSGELSIISSTPKKKDD